MSAAISFRSMPNSLTTLTRKFIFAPLDDAGRTEIVVDRIRTAITLGIFADGEQLPNELVFASQLGVSPVTLRDALRMIRAEGLVRTVRGRSGGSFVIAPRESNVHLFERALAALSPIELRDLLDWQEAVMRHAVRLASERASTRELIGLRHTAVSVRQADSAITARRAYSRLLIEIAASSRSSRLSRAAISLQVEYAPLSTLAFWDSAARYDISELVDELTEAIADRAADQAEIAMTSLSGWLGDRIQHLRHDVVASMSDQRDRKVGEE